MTRQVRDRFPLPSSETIASAYSYWFGLVNFERKSPLAKDLKLDRMNQLLSRLGNPHRRLRIVHVAGSKGKGSTSAMVASILNAAGYRTGLFTSPHLTAPEERIQIDGCSISREELATLLLEIEERSRGIEDLTFFEVITASGFLHFVRRRVDIVVLEVGLGGRFDSTNVCEPLVSIITSISLDHTNQLGDRVEQIAWEKAGIVKSGRLVVSGNTLPAVCEVIEGVCREVGAPLRQLGREFSFEHVSGEVRDDSVVWPKVSVTTERGSYREMTLGLLGEHQASNAAIALACVEELQRIGFHISLDSIRSGFERVRWPARMEVMGTRPFVVLDCAHNEASAESVVRTLDGAFPRRRRYLVFASSQDKDLPSVSRVLGSAFDRVFLTRYQDNARAASPEGLVPLFETAGTEVSVCATARAAWESAKAVAKIEDLICITGSVFLAGELRPLVVAECSRGAG